MVKLSFHQGNRAHDLNLVTRDASHFEMAVKTIINPWH
jgi:hypothetical protein